MKYSYLFGLSFALFVLSSCVVTKEDHLNCNAGKLQTNDETRIDGNTEGCRSFTGTAPN